MVAHTEFGIFKLMEHEERYPKDYKKLKRIEGTGHARALNFTCFQERPFLRSERAIGWFVESATRAMQRHDISLWAYVIMPTHVHLLVLPKRSTTQVADFLFSLKRSVAGKAVSWTKIHAPDKLEVMVDRQPSGAECHRFWQRGGGYDRNLWTERAMWEMIEYVHDNPVEAGFCKRRADWRWSSAAYYQSKTPGPLELDLKQLPARPNNM